MQHIMLVTEVAMADFFYPVCGEWTFWCVAGVEVLGPSLIFLAILVLWETLA